MIAHYLKVAFRNLWKYKTQHLIALVGVGGLAVFQYLSLRGPLCFQYESLFCKL